LVDLDLGEAPRSAEYADENKALRAGGASLHSIGRLLGGPPESGAAAQSGGRPVGTSEAQGARAVRDTAANETLRAARDGAQGHAFKLNQQDYEPSPKCFGVRGDAGPSGRDRGGRSRT